MSDAWDFVTIQQASHFSTKWESYEPYLEKIAECVKLYAPQAKLIVHQTWQYDEAILAARKTANSPEEMLSSLREAYALAAEYVSAQGIIPSGETVAALIKNGITTPHRDGYHLSLGAGRLAIGLLWYCYFMKKAPDDILMPMTDAPVSDEEIEIIKKSVKEVLSA